MATTEFAGTNGILPVGVAMRFRREISRRLKGKGFTRDMACWSTMTECVRRGLTVDFQGRDGWEINPQ